jgi:hypothetical protein
MILLLGFTPISRTPYNPFSTSAGRGGLVLLGGDTNGRPT